MPVSVKDTKDRVSRYQNMRRGVSAFDKRLMSSTAGKAFRQGVAESMGFYYEGGFAMQGKSMGFLGLRGNLAESGLGKRASRFGSAYSNARTLGKGAGIGASVKAGFSAARHFGGKMSAGSMAWGGTKFLGKTALAALGPAFVAMDIHQGYKEGGVIGAITGGAKSMAIMGAFNVGMTAIGGIGTLAPIAAVAAAGYGYYAFGEAAQAKEKSLQKMELGGVAMDALGSAGAATTRQRSMMALQNTHLNGRMALGQEATIMHTPFR